MDPLTMTAGASFYGTIISAISCIGPVHSGMIQMTGTSWLAIIYVSTLASLIAFFAWNALFELLAGTISTIYQSASCWDSYFWCATIT